MRGFYNDTVTRWRAAAVPGIQGRRRDWANAEPLELTNVRVQPAGPDAYRLMGPLAVDLVESDRLSRVLPGGALEWFEVTSEPQRFRSPTGVADHSETALEGFAHG